MRAPAGLLVGAILGCVLAALWFVAVPLLGLKAVPLLPLVGALLLHRRQATLQLACIAVLALAVSGLEGGAMAPAFWAAALGLLAARTASGEEEAAAFSTEHGRFALRFLTGWAAGSLLLEGPTAGMLLRCVVAFLLTSLVFAACSLKRLSAGAPVEAHAVPRAAVVRLGRS